MPEVIWTGEIFHDGQYRDGRAVLRDDPHVVFEYFYRPDAMNEPIWKRVDFAPQEFLIAAAKALSKK